jgi:hypothetical protein
MPVRGNSQNPRGAARAATILQLPQAKIKRLVFWCRVFLNAKGSCDIFPKGGTRKPRLLPGFLFQYPEYELLLCHWLFHGLAVSHWPAYHVSFFHVEGYLRPTPALMHLSAHARWQVRKELADAGCGSIISSSRVSILSLSGSLSPPGSIGTGKPCTQTWIKERIPK